jgi:RNA ligase (TIGR02306 family)
MSDWNPQVIKIEKVEKHPHADALDVATVLGDYPVIIKRGEYKPGDAVGYIPIDSIVPDTDQFYFLCPRVYEKIEDDAGLITNVSKGPKYLLGSVPEKYRIIKAKKIRGIYSQGMLVNIGSWLNDPMDTGPAGGCHMDGIKYPYVAGDSIVEFLGLKKWEENEEENVSVKKTRGTNAEKAPVGWSIPHYDIDGVRKYLACLQPNEEIVLSEKVHGSNAAFCHDGTRLWVKSRNFYKRMDPDDMWWDVAMRYDLENKLKAYPGKVFFGEVFGQVKGFRYDTVVEGGQLLTQVRFFDVWDTKTLRYLDYDPFVAIVKDAGLDIMPELYRGPWLGKEVMYPYAEGLTTLGGKHIREGWVLRTIKERYEPRLDSRMHVKLVGEGYNLQK